jgi:hypothetical protein
VGKKWLFWFCEGLAFVTGKNKCAIYAAGSNCFLKMCSEKKYKLLALRSAV